MKKLTIAALQLPTLGMQATKLEFYLKNAHSRGAEIILLGEYVLNHFFKELPNMPIKMVKEQSEKHILLLKKFSKKYNMIFIAPILVVEQQQYKKTIVKITPESTSFYEQQILIPYKHWNEKKFFSNTIQALHPPMVFKIKNFNIMVMSGFELHFDNFWSYVSDKEIDLVLLPTASTFESHNRWREIIKTKAFLHGCYILRANRLGEYVENGVKWKFYGDSMLVDPNGEIYMMLEDRESMLIETIKKSVIKEHRKHWQFEKELNIRKKL